MNAEHKGGSDVSAGAEAAAPPPRAGWVPREHAGVSTTPIPGLHLALPSTGRSDHDLHLERAIVAMSRREESGLRDLYDAAVPRVLGLALRITRNRNAAEDVVAEVFHQAWRTADRYDPARGAALTWLLTICRSRAIDHLRRRDEAESHPDPASLAMAEVDPIGDPQSLLAVDPVTPSADRSSALRDRVLAITRPVFVAPGAPLSNEPPVTIRTDEGRWLRRGPGVEIKILHESAHSSSVLYRLAPGGILPPHGHIGEEECIVLSGSATIGDQLVQAGDFHLAGAGTDHTAITSITGALLFVRNGHEAWV